MGSHFLDRGSRFRQAGVARDFRYFDRRQRSYEIFRRSSGAIAFYIHALPTTAAGFMGLLFDISDCGSDRIRMFNNESLWSRAAGHGGAVLAQSSLVDS